MIEGIKLDLAKVQEIQLSPNAFIEMKNLRLLILHNANVSGNLDCLSNELKLLD